MVSRVKSNSDFSIDAAEASDQVGSLASMTQQTAGATEEESQGEDIEATPEQLQKLRQVMDSDTTSAIVEGLVQSDP